MIPVLLILSACAGIQKNEELFADKKGCFLLFNMKTGKYEKEVGTTCREQFVACSTFKVPLAVMAFDSGILKDEKEVLKWDGVQRKKVAEWNQDHNAQTWMAHSVVWFSQRLTPKLGEENFRKYLKDFNYGNQDISHGITDAWLVSPSSPDSSLRVSPYEQVEFLKALWKGDLPASKRSMELTRKITYRETTPSGFVLSGKTGSNFYDNDGQVQLGWFISHLQRGSEEYIAVVQFSDLKPKKEGTFGGPRARDMLKEFLSREKLW